MDDSRFAAVALNYFAYNVIKIHRTRRVTPAMAAGVTTRLFDVSALVALLIEQVRRSGGALLTGASNYGRAAGR